MLHQLVAGLSQSHEFIHRNCRSAWRLSIHSSMPWRTFGLGTKGLQTKVVHVSKNSVCLLEVSTKLGQTWTLRKSTCRFKGKAQPNGHTVKQLASESAMEQLEKSTCGLGCPNMRGIGDAGGITLLTSSVDLSEAVQTFCSPPQ